MSKILNVAKECGLTFPNPYSANLLGSSTKTILTGFQYRLAMLLLYDLEHYRQGTGITLLDHHFRELPNNSALENHTFLISVVEEIRQLFESKGIYFLDSNIVQLDRTFNSSISRTEVENVLNFGMPKLSSIDTKDIQILSYLKKITEDNLSSNEKGINVDYTDLSHKTSLSSISLRKRTDKMYRLGLLEKIYDYEPGRKDFYRMSIIVKLNMPVIMEILKVVRL